MGANAGELLETMTVRLKMLMEGTINPSDSVKAATRVLVEKLSAIDPSEDVEIYKKTSSLVEYIRSSTGEVLAEINLDE
jgi:hypothetical protein